ncbi:MAG: hypothetical protein JNM31_02510 [Flavobacteriales bacterium]|nr:hypothetical protein [Flavobacteriales bacterium]
MNHRVPLLACSGQRLGDHMDFGANAVIIGPITIGSDVLIGAGAVVFKEVPTNAVLVGNPGRIIPGS